MVTEDLPEVSVEEIEIAFGQLKNGKAHGEDSVTTELLKVGGQPVPRELQKLLTLSCLKGELRRRGVRLWSSFLFLSLSH
jgi:hypothetical protein